MSGDLSPPSSLAESRQDSAPDPKVWGRRTYADPGTRELLNDVSRAIAQTEPDHVNDPTDPSLSEVLQQAKRGIDPEVKGSLLADLMGQGLNFREAVCWYWYQHAQLELSEIYFATEGYSCGGDPERRADHVDQIADTLRSAASKLNTTIDLDHES